MSHLLRRSSKTTKSIGSIELGAVLGQGAFGKVMLAYDTVRKQNVAVKFIDKKLVKENNLSDYVEREISMMKQLKHPYVVSLLSVTVSTKGHYLVMELAENGELFDRIVESKRFDEDTARRYFQQLMSALIYCHKKGIVHRDLKAENLLLGKNGDLLICDFGLSRYVAMNSSTNQEDFDKGKDFAKVIFKSLAGSADYQAPEVIGEGGYQGFSCDVWSSGVILFFMVCGYLPFAGKTEIETHDRIMKLEYNCDNNKYLSDSLKDLLKHIFVLNPKTRYTTDDIVAHPWFQAGSKSGFLTLSPSSPLQILTPTSKAASPTALENTVYNNGDNFPNSLTEQEKHTSTLELDKLHAAFSSVDTDHSGYLTKSQVQHMLEKIHDKHVGTHEVDDFIAKFDHDADGRISEEQFIVGWTRNSDLSSAIDVYKLINLFHDNLEKELLASLRKSFDEFIVFLDKSGVIPDANFDTLVKSLDMTREEGKELRTMIENMKGNLTFDAFVSLCTTRNLLTKNTTARRLRSVSMMFDEYERPVFRSYINTGFTVAGMRETILAKIMRCAETVNTVYTRDDNGEGLVYGKHSQEGKDVLHIGIQLRPAVKGYTKILAYRIRGRTDIFHEWFQKLIKLFREEIMLFEKDTAPTGESELM